MEQEHNVKKGAIYQVIAWFFFALMYLVSKWIADDASASVRLFFRGWVGTLLALPWMIRYGKESFLVKSPGWLTVRALSSALNIAFIFLAIETISLVDTTLLTNSAPFFVPFLAFLMLKKPMNSRLWAPIVLGFIGVIFVLKPTPKLLNLGALFALGSGIFTALSSVSLRAMGGVVKNHTVQFYMFLLSTIVMLPFALLNWEISSWVYIFPLISIGALAFVAQIFYYKSFQSAEASHVAPFGYSCVLFSGIFDWCFFHDFPGAWTFFGMFLVIASGLWILQRSKAPPAVNS